MSYNILQQPLLFQPAYNSSVFVVTSSNNTQPNFSYIGTISINGSTFPLKAFPDPVYGSGVFDVGRIVENYVTSDINKDQYGFQINTNSYASYSISFGEEYGASSGVIQYPGLATTPTKYVWNGVVDFIPFQSYAINTYAADGNVTLNRNITRKIQLEQSAWFYFFSNDTATYDKAIVNAYNSAGALIRAVEIANPYTSSGTIGNHFLRVDAGPYNLDGIDISFITDTLGTGAIIPTNTAYYTYQLEGTAASPTYRFNMTEADCRYETFRLHWLNRLGAFESFNFTKVSRKDIDVKRDKYKAVVGGLTSASTYGYAKSDRGDKAYFTMLKDGLKLNSDWLSDEEHSMLEELVSSPEIYIDDPTHGLIAVTCTNSKIDVKTRLNNKIFNLEIDLEYSYNRYTQRQ